jgi:tyrosyl-DNA phosphodiesterase 1
VDPVPVPNDDVNDAALDPDAQFEADLARALKLSEQQSRQDTEELSPAAPAPHISNISTSIRQQTDGFLSERAQMEKARLERLSRLCPDLITSSSSTATNLKRSRDASPSSSDDEDEDVSSSKKYRPSSSERLKAADSPQLFWNTHEIRQTANVFVESPGDTKSTWRLSEIIGPVRISSLQ